MHTGLTVGLLQESELFFPRFIFFCVVGRLGSSSIASSFILRNVFFSLVLGMKEKRERKGRNVS